MFIKHDWDIYKKIQVEDLSKEELLEIMKWLQEVPKEIVIREIDKIKSFTVSPATNPVYQKYLFCNN